MPAISGAWEAALAGEFRQPYYRDLYNTVKKEYQTRTIYPPASDLFSAFHLTPLEEVKVVILGQDPYHEPGQAHGLCFSVKPGIEIPPSLQNIYQEIHDDLGLPIPKTGCLESWAKQGVLLLNSVLTVRAHAAFSHANIGWQTFTDHVLQIVDRKDAPVVYMLWGKPAREKKKLLTNPRHLILEAPHPSPLSAYRGFFGCRHFSKANEFLIENGAQPIDWSIKDTV